VVLKKTIAKPAGSGGGGGGGGVKTSAGITAHKLDSAGTEDDASFARAFLITIPACKHAIVDAIVYVPHFAPFIRQKRGQKHE
jgi:hypothetical protein